MIPSSPPARASEIAYGAFEGSQSTADCSSKRFGSTVLPEDSLGRSRLRCADR
jgi:hypothetical protein